MYNPIFACVQLTAACFVIGIEVFSHWKSSSFLKKIQIISKVVFYASIMLAFLHLALSLDLAEEKFEKQTKMRVGFLSERVHAIESQYKGDREVLANSVQRIFSENEKLYTNLTRDFQQSLFDLVKSYSSAIGTAQHHQRPYDLLNEKRVLSETACEKLDCEHSKNRELCEAINLMCLPTVQ